jgi:hypothetical protein
MNDNEMQLALATALGWTDLHMAYGGLCGWQAHFPKGKFAVQVVPDWPNDANAVIALLEREGSSEINRMHRLNIGWQWEVKVWTTGFFPLEAEAPTFCRAACLALLQAHAAPAASEKDAK